MINAYQRAFILSQTDNVAVALMDLKEEHSVSLGGAFDGQINAQDYIPEGHKIAIKAIPIGESIVKGGVPIGYAVVDIPLGSHVHTHNISSFTQKVGDEKDGSDEK